MMNDESIEEIEQQLAHLKHARAPADLRAPVLRTVSRQLTAQRWDRRLARTAAALVAVGVGANVLVAVQDRQPAASQVLTASHSYTIAQIAVAVAEATDAATGSRIGQHLAALSGAALSPEQTAALEQEIQRRVKSGASSRREG